MRHLCWICDIFQRKFEAFQNTGNIWYRHHYHQFIVTMFFVLRHREAAWQRWWGLLFSWSSPCQVISLSEKQPRTVDIFRLPCIRLLRDEGSRWNQLQVEPHCQGNIRKLLWHLYLHFGTGGFSCIVRYLMRYYLWLGWTKLITQDDGRTFCFGPGDNEPFCKAPTTTTTTTGAACVCRYSILLAHHLIHFYTTASTRNMSTYQLNDWW